MARHGTRYLRILRGNDRAAKDRLLQYLNGDIDATYPRTPNPKRTAVYWVRPFGFDFPAAKKIMQSLSRRSSATTANLGQSLLQGFAFGPPAAADQIILKGVLAPRVAITFNRTATGTRRTSQITGRSYKSYSGDTAVFPFGAGTTASQKTEDAVFKILFARAKEQDSSNVCSFVPGSWSI
jgi:hypothetical protein